MIIMIIMIIIMIIIIIIILIHSSLAINKITIYNKQYRIVIKYSIVVIHIPT